MEQKKLLGNSCHGSAVMNPTSIHEDLGLIPGLPPWVKESGIAVSWDAGCRGGLDPRIAVAVA